MILKSVKQLIDEEGSAPDLPVHNVGWNSDRPQFEEIVRSIGQSPKVIVEVGSFVGQSALRLASLCPDALILCVDAWAAGSFEHMGTAPQFPIKQKWGVPLLYEQFLANVNASAFSDRVFPIRLTSDVASRLIATLPFHPDACYIDGSHEHGQVWQDMFNYWRLLGPGGVMWGDDVNTFPGVLCDLQRFCYDFGLKPEIKEPFWVLRKP